MKGEVETSIAQPDVFKHLSVLPTRTSTGSASTYTESKGEFRNERKQTVSKCTHYVCTRTALVWVPSLLDAR